MRRIGVTLSVVVLALWAAASEALAGIVQKSGFSLSLPDGWVEIPQEVLAEMRNELSRQSPNAKIPIYDYGFQLGTAQRWMEYPYVLVQVDNLGRIPENELKSMPRIDMSETINSVSINLKAIMSNVMIGQRQYDQAAHVVWWTVQADTVGLGRVQGLSGLIPTEKGFLGLHGYALESNFQDYVGIFHQIVKSVAVSPELAYKPRWTDSSRILSGIDWEKVAEKAIVGAIIGLLYPLFAHYRRKKKA